MRNHRTTTGRRAYSLIAAFAMITGLLLPLQAAVAVAETTPSLWTTDIDGNARLDFLPEETVYIHGAGFAANTAYDIPVTRPNGSIVLGDGSFLPGWDTTTTDAAGNLYYEYILNGVFGEYLTETFVSPWGGPGSGDQLVASVLFTDAPGIAHEQCQPGPFDKTTYNCAITTNDGWKTGLNQGKFARGDSIPYRGLLKDMVVGVQYTLKIEYDTTKAGEHAIDYLTTYNRTMREADACLRSAPWGPLASPGPCDVQDTEPIPIDPTVTSGPDGIAGNGDDIVQAPGDFTLFGGGTIDSVEYTGGDFTGTGIDGDPYMYANDGRREVTVVFTANVDGEMALAWGGHIATNQDWADMANPSGSPYHMRFNDFSCPDDGSDACSTGQQDRALTESAVIDELPVISVDKTANPTSVDEPGANVLFTFTVENDSAEPVTLTSLVDSDFGDLNGQGTCVTPQALAASDGTLGSGLDFYSCTVTIFIAGDASDPDHENTVTGTAVDDTGNEATDDGVATVRFNDVLPDITVDKDNDANRDIVFTDTETTSFANIGGTVTYRVKITNNTDEDNTIDSITDDKVAAPLVSADLGDVDCDSLIGTTLAAGATVTCYFDGTAPADDNDSLTNTVEVKVSDNDGKTDTESDMSTVKTPDILPDITVDKDNDANRDIVFTDTETTSFANIGGTVTYRVKITNNTDEDNTIDSITDDKVAAPLVSADLGDVDCDSLIGTTLAAGATVTCYFDGTAPADDNDSLTNTVEVKVSDNDGKTDTESDMSTVKTPDILPDITVDKDNDANRDIVFTDTETTSFANIGGTVTYRVKITNNTDEDNTIDSITDDKVAAPLVSADLGDVDCDSLIGTTLAAGATVTCYFDGTAPADDNDSLTNTVEVKVSDNDGKTDTESDMSTVKTPDILPDITVDKDNDANRDIVFTDTETTSFANIGGTVTYRVKITNNTDEDNTIDSITDDKVAAPLVSADLGDVDCDSLIGTTLAAGATVTCYFDGTAPADDNDSLTNTVEVKVSDNDGKTDTESDMSTVKTPDILPDITVDKDNDANRDIVFTDTETTSFANIGGTVTYRVKITNNTDEDNTIDSITDDKVAAPLVSADLGDVDCDSLIGTTLAAGATVTCYFDGTAPADDNDSLTNTVEVKVSDNDGKTDTESDMSTVKTPDILPDITVDKDNDANRDIVFTDTETTSFANIGGTVTYRVKITNNTDEDNTIDSITDDKVAAPLVSADLGDVDCDSLIGTTLAAGATVTCYFDGTAPADDNDSLTNTVEVKVSDNDGKTDTESDMSTVKTPDILPDITVDKDNDANRDIVFTDTETTSFANIGGTVTYRVKITNNTDEDNTIDSITDDKVAAPLVSADLGDVDCDSLIGTTLAAGATVTCYFDGTAPADDNDSLTNTVEVKVSDNDGKTDTESDMSTVKTPDIIPTATLVKTADPTAVFTGTNTEVTFTILVTNTTVGEAVDVTALVDDIYGDILNLADAKPQTGTTCVLPQALAPAGQVGDSYQCTFTAIVDGPAFTDEVDTVTATVSDDDSNTIYPYDDATVMILAQNLVTSSALCDFGGHFNLIFTPDGKNWPAYKLSSSNPGQFFYNVFLTGDPDDVVSLDLSIPYPFITQGANPVHGYDDVGFHEEDGFTCFDPGESQDINVDGAPFTLATHGSPQEVTVTGVIPDTGILYVNIHLDYGLKGPQTDADDDGNPERYDRIGIDPDLDAINQGVGPDVLNETDYEFSYAALVDGDASAMDTSVSNWNIFKKPWGFFGMVVSSATGDPAANQTVEIWKGSELIGTATTDEDGYYLFDYKHKGKRTEYTVKLQGTTQEQTLTLGGKVKFLEGTFYL